MAPSDHALPDLIGQTYEAVSDPGQWVGLLESVAELTRSSVGWVGMPLFGGHRWPRVIQFGSEDARRDDYESYYWTIDPWLARSVPSQLVGRVTLGHTIVPTAEIQKTEFYNDYFSRGGVLHHFTAHLGCTRNGEVSTLSAARSPAAGEYTDDEVRVVRQLVPHLQRALVLDRELVGRREPGDGIRDVLDRVSMGVLVTDAGGRLIEANRIAEMLLRAGDVLSMRRDRLVAAAPGADAVLQRLIAQTAATSRGDRIDPGGWITLDATSGSGPLLALVSPGGSRDRKVPGGGGRVLIFITDPDRGGLIPAEPLCRLWGLTQSEAQVVSRLAAGQTVREIAAGRSVRPDTVRIQLKQVFTKTGTARQSELVALVLRTLGPLITPPARDISQ